MRSLSKRTIHGLIVVVILASLAAPALAASHDSLGSVSSASNVIRRFLHWILDDDPTPPPLSERPSIPPG
jgi:hypothetical protein